MTSPSDDESRVVLSPNELLSVAFKELEAARYDLQTLVIELRISVKKRP